MQIKAAPVALGAIVLLVGVAAVAMGRTRERPAGQVVRTAADVETATFALG